MTVAIKQDRRLLAQKSGHLFEQLSDAGRFDQIVDPLTMSQIAGGLDQIGSQWIDRCRAECLGEPAAHGIRFRDKQETLITDDLTQILSEEKAGRPSPADEHLTNCSFTIEPVARRSFEHYLIRMDNAAKWFGERSLIYRQVTFDPNCIDRWNRDIFGQRAR